MASNTRIVTVCNTDSVRLSVIASLYYSVYALLQCTLMALCSFSPSTKETFAYGTKSVSYWNLRKYPRNGESPLTGCTASSHCSNALSFEVQTFVAQTTHQSGDVHSRAGERSARISQLTHGWYESWPLLGIVATKICQQIVIDFQKK